MDLQIPFTESVLSNQQPSQSLGVQISQLIPQIQFNQQRYQQELLSSITTPLIIPHKYKFITQQHAQSERHFPEEQQQRQNHGQKRNQQEVKQLGNEISPIKNPEDLSKETNSSLANAYSELKEQNLLLSRRLETIGENDQVLKKMTKKIENQNQRQQKLVNTNSIFKMQLSKKEIQQHQFKEIINSLESQIQIQQSAFQQINSMKESTNKDHTRTIQKLKKQINSYQSKLTNAKREFETLKMTNLQTHKAALQLKQKIKRMERQYQLMNKMRQQKEQQLQMTNQKLKDLKKSLEQTKRQFQESKKYYQQQIRKLKKQSQQNKRRNEEETIKMKQVHKQEVNKLQKEKSKLQVQNKKTKSQLEKTNLQLKKQKADLNIKTKQLIQSQAQNRTLGQNNQKLELEKTKLMKEIQIQKGQLNQNQVEKERFISQIKQWRQRLAQRERQLAGVRNELENRNGLLSEIYKQIRYEKQQGHDELNRIFLRICKIKYFNDSVILKPLDQTKTAFLADTLKVFIKKQDFKTHLLYRYDPLNTTNFHSYFDKKANLFTVVQISNGTIIGGFSSYPVSPTGVQKPGNGFIFNLNYQTVYYPRQYPKLPVISYDNYYFIMGNAEIRLKSQQKKIFSNFGIANSTFDSQGHDRRKFLNVSDNSNNELEIKTYEIYQIELDT